MVLFYAVVALAVLTMSYGLWLCIQLRRIAQGGHVGRVAGWLLAFICLFMAGYIAAPFFPLMPQEAIILISGGIFLFGAIFVVIVLRMMQQLVRQFLAQMEKL